MGSPVPGSSFTERHSRGLGARGDDEASYDQAIERYGASGAWAVDHVLGEVWARAELGPRDRSLAVVAAIAALGSSTALPGLVSDAIAQGLTVSELDEVLGHVMAYAGLPRAIDAYEVLVEVADLEWPDRSVRAPLQKDDGERLADAYDVMSTIGGGRVPPSPEAGLAWFENSIGALGRSVYLWIFGELWSRPGLSRRDRSLVVLAMITALGSTHEFRTHATAGLHHGLSREEIEEIMITLGPYVGAPRAVGALRAVRELWVQHDKADSPA